MTLTSFEFLQRTLLRGASERVGQHHPLLYPCAGPYSENSQG